MLTLTLCLAIFAGPNDTRPVEHRCWPVRVESRRAFVRELLRRWDGSGAEITETGRDEYTIEIVRLPANVI